MAAAKKGLMSRDAAPPAQPRLSPEEMMRATEEAAPELPPTRLAARQTEASIPPQPSAGKEVTGAFAFRMRTSTLASLARVAHGKGMTQKQIVCIGLRSMGVDVAEADLEDRSPRRRQQFLDT